MKGLKHRKEVSCTLLLFSVLLLTNFTPESEVSSYHGEEDETFQFLFYNVENLFDIDNNPETNDDEFTAEGSRRWTNSRYYRKLNSLAKVIIAAGDWGPPDMIGLSEVENIRVVEDLARRTTLSNFNLGIVCAASDDPRGITLAFIYNRDKVTVSTSKRLIPFQSDDSQTFRSRPVLYLKLVIDDEPLHLFLNHWPSRRGGVLGGQALRILLAEEIVEEVDVIREEEGDNSAIIIAGDFNCSPGDQEVELLRDAGFVNLASEAASSGKGTYRFRGVWQMLDQILVSNPMSEGTAPFIAGPFRITDHDFLLYDDPVFPGKKPFSTYGGFTYVGGYSDHLPVLLKISRFGYSSYEQDGVPSKQQLTACTPWLPCVHLE